MNGNSRGDTQVIFKEDARKRLLKGMSTASEAVGCTLGPKGRTVLIQREGHSPVATKDGVTVSKAIRLSDPVERMGAELIREAATQTNDTAGDGTTTATILTHAMVTEGLKLLTAGYPSLNLCRGIERGTAAVVQALKAEAKEIKTSEEIAQVGTISANGDVTIGNLIAKAMDQVGRDGIITVEDAKGMQTTMDVVEGMQFERGYLSPFFVTDNDRACALYDNCRVLVTDKKISSLREIIPILEAVVQNGERLLIIGDDVEGEALNGLVLNRVQQNLPVVAIKAPGYGDHKHELLNDICRLTGATLISSKMGTKLETMTPAELGTCKRVVVSTKTTTLIGTGATKDDLEKHVDELKAQLEDVTLTPESISRLRERVARLAGGVAIIRVGGATEVEMIERKYRIEDALHATKAATDEGIVRGGGIALWAASEALTQFSIDDSDRSGLEVVSKALSAPLARIVANAGRSPEVVMENLVRGRNKSNVQYLGYDAATGEEVDMMQKGIIDPVKVTRSALQNAASVAVTFLSLDAVIYDVREESNNG